MRPPRPSWRLRPPRSVGGSPGRAGGSPGNLGCSLGSWGAYLGAWGTHPGTWGAHWECAVLTQELGVLARQQGALTQELGVLTWEHAVLTQEPGVLTQECGALTRECGVLTQSAAFRLGQARPPASSPAHWLPLGRQAMSLIRGCPKPFLEFSKDERCCPCQKNPGTGKDAALGGQRHHPGAQPKGPGLGPPAHHHSGSWGPPLPGLCPVPGTRPVLHNHGLGHQKESVQPTAFVRDSCPLVAWRQGRSRTHACEKTTAGATTGSHGAKPGHCTHPPGPGVLAEGCSPPCRTQDAERPLRSRRRR